MARYRVVDLGAKSFFAGRSTNFSAPVRLKMRRDGRVGTRAPWPFTNGTG